MSGIPEEFNADYYDRLYFAGKKKFKMANGSIREWGYNNPQGEFLGAKKIAEAWKTMFNPKNALDAFCGRGTFVAYMRDIGIEAYGFDFSKFAINNPYPRCKKEWLKLHDGTKRWPYQDKSFDLIVMLDAYEHVYEEDLDFVISEMYRVAKKWVFLQIATVDGVKEKGYILKKGEPIPLDKDPRTWAGHCTVCTEQWWYERLESEDWMPRRDMVNWFIALVPNEIIKNWLANSIIVLERV